MSEKYTIGELAKRLDITPRTIRFYDQKGLVKPDSITEKGYRIYSEAQIKRFKIIIVLKELGLSLKDIQKILDNPNGDDLANLMLNQQKFANEEEIAALQRKKSEIVQLQKMLSEQSSIEELADIKQIMNDEARYNRLERSILKFAVGILFFEAIGIALIVYLLSVKNGQHIFQS